MVSLAHAMYPRNVSYHNLQFWDVGFSIWNQEILRRRQLSLPILKPNPALACFYYRHKHGQDGELGKVGPAYVLSQFIASSWRPYSSASIFSTHPPLTINRTFWLYKKIERFFFFLSFCFCKFLAMSNLFNLRLAMISHQSWCLLGRPCAVRKLQPTDCYQM